MIIDGKKISEEIKNELKEAFAKRGKKMKLAVVFVGDDEPSRRFIERKKKFGEAVGVDTEIYNLPTDISARKLRQKIAEISRKKDNTGIIVQLPLPEKINSQYILNGIVLKKDVDVLSSRAFGNFTTNHSGVLPPVAGAVKEILERGKVDVKAKNVVVVGAGMLVGKPVASWLMNEGATVSVVNEFTADISKFTKEADIIISGVGKPKLITSDMVKEGVVIIDAGTSMLEGKLVGDVDPAVSEKASFFTPVPGGVGPLTVAMVFRNLLELNK